MSPGLLSRATAGISSPGIPNNTGASVFNPSEGLLFIRWDCSKLANVSSVLWLPGITLSAPEFFLTGSR